MTEHHYPIRESIWTVKDKGTQKKPMDNVHVVGKENGDGTIIVSGDDRKWMMSNNHYLFKLYKKIFLGKETRKLAKEQKRLVILKIQILPNVMGYADRDIYNEKEYGNLES